MLVLCLHSIAIIACGLHLQFGGGVYTWKHCKPERGLLINGSPPPVDGAEGVFDQDYFGFLFSGQGGRDGEN